MCKPTLSLCSDEQGRVAAASTSFLSVGAVIGIVVVLMLIVLVIIDVSCYFINGCGVTKTICVSIRGGSGGGKTGTSSKEKAMEQGERFVRGIIVIRLLNRENSVNLLLCEIYYYKTKTRYVESADTWDNFSSVCSGYS